MCSNRAHKQLSHTTTAEYNNVTMHTYAVLAPVLQILLQAIAQERGTTQEHLSLEIEHTTLKALMAAYQMGFDEAHERPTAVRPIDPNIRKPRED